MEKEEEKQQNNRSVAFKDSVYEEEQNMSLTEQLMASLKKFHDTCFDKAGKPTRYLSDFMEVGFNPDNLSDLLEGAGVGLSAAIKELHAICFTEEGKPKKYLSSFIEAGFTPGDLSTLLRGSGVEAASALRKLYDICFDEKGHSTEYLTKFYSRGMKR